MTDTAPVRMHNLRALDLSTLGPACELEQLAMNNGLHLIYLPISAIRRLEQPADKFDGYPQLAALVERLGVEYSPILGDSNAAAAGRGRWSFVPALDHQSSNEIATVLAGSHEGLQLVFVPVGFYQLASDRIRLSVFFSREWLFWDDSELWNGTADLSRANAWCGSGWASLRTRMTFEDPDQANDAALHRLLSQITQAAREFVVHRRLMSDLPCNGTEEDHSIRELAETLARYLPRYVHRPRSNKPLQLGDVCWRQLGWADLEPKEWDGLWDSSLAPASAETESPRRGLRRAMILDGWLTLWPDKNDPNQLWLQPGSLALLFWAAATLGERHTNTPRDFLNNYEWRYKFFGGRVGFGADFETSPEPVGSSEDSHE